MGNDEEIRKEIEKLLEYIREKRITLSKQGKARLAQKFPALKEKIQKLEETQPPSSKKE